MSDLVPDAYAATLEDLKKHVRAARLEAAADDDEGEK